MIVILEGCNGTGKTSYVKAIGESLGVRPFRVFRGGDFDGHWDGDRKAEADALRQMGVPVNTFVDEMYTADWARCFPEVNMVVDRALLSAIAYGIVEKQDGPFTGPEASALYGIWMDMLGRHGKILLVMLQARYETAEARSPGRTGGRKRFNALNRQFKRLFQQFVLPKMIIDTDLHTIGNGVRLVRNKLYNGNS